LFQVLVKLEKEALLEEKCIEKGVSAPEYA